MIAKGLLQLLTRSTAAGSHQGCGQRAVIATPSRSVNGGR